MTSLARMLSVFGVGMQAGAPWLGCAFGGLRRSSKSATKNGSITDESPGSAVAARAALGTNGPTSWGRACREM